MKGGRKSFLSFFGLRKRDYYQREEVEQERRSSAKIWVSDHDKGRWVAEQDIDRKAANFIYKEHQRLKQQSERHFVMA
ncbi:hypothetical protein MA16_Dca016214 [Dendrobium catenatum]|uniref:Uncharacterized protein n=1 Tax=Dendrobium catenatum TaxID=906689 RepID=A0A2I0VVP8_9ASPA|nr:hypothetical protein MA16_Dca016214 [Dendrobium catenatum]